MPFVNVEWAPRSLEMRREVAKAITDVICKVTGNEPSTVRVVFTDVESDHIAEAGKLFSDRQKETE